MLNDRGFTLMELLIATSAAVLLVGTTMGIYNQVIQGETQLRREEADTFRKIQLTALLEGALTRARGPVYGDPDRLAMISDVNLLGYGPELIHLARVRREKTEAFEIRIVPMLWSGAVSDVGGLRSLYDAPYASYTYSHEERIEGVAPRFSYRQGGTAVDRLSGERPELISITVESPDDNEWRVSRTWQ